mgnify:CR=1 FL=1
MEQEIAENSFKIKTSSFEGPFNLLLSLIEDRKLFINDVSLASVTEEYLKYVSEVGSRNPSELSSFVNIAATLILIKSKSLLPNLELTREEESDISSLEIRLKLYELFTNLSEKVKEDFGNKIIFQGGERKDDLLVFLPDSQITKERMMTFANDALGRMPKKTVMAEVEVKKVISLEEMIDDLTNRIEQSIKMNFREFAGTAKTKEEKVLVVVGFLAILELVKQGILSAEQGDNFEDIIIEKETITITEEFNI